MFALNMLVWDLVGAQQIFVVVHFINFIDFHLINQLSICLATQHKPSFNPTSIRTGLIILPGASVSYPPFFHPFPTRRRILRVLLSKTSSKMCLEALFSFSTIQSFFQRIGHWPILSQSRNVRPYVCLSPFMQFFFEASHWPSGHMIRSRPLIDRLSLRGIRQGSGSSV